jgi:hypothetical protein
VHSIYFAGVALINDRGAVDEGCALLMQSFPHFRGDFELIAAATQSVDMGWQSIDNGAYTEMRIAGARHGDACGFEFMARCLDPALRPRVMEASRHVRVSQGWLEAVYYVRAEAPA